MTDNETPMELLAALARLDDALVDAAEALRDVAVAIGEMERLSVEAWAAAYRAREEEDDV